MKLLEDIIENEIKNTLLKEEADNEIKSTPLENLDAALKQLQSQDENFEAYFAPYLALRDIFKLALTGLKIILNDVVFIAKSTLAVRPSSWKLAREAHDKRLAKLNKDWEASLSATGADSSTASLISFLAFPAPMISAALVSQGFKTVASVNHALVDSGIRLPLVGLLPGATPPDEIDMDEEKLKKKKRGELSTKDAVKVALMKLFFAHHSRPGKIISEEKEKSIKISSDVVKQSLKDMGVYEKAQEDLQGLMSAKSKSVEKFFESENPVEKVKNAAALLKANTPEALVKISKTIQDKDMTKLIDDYIKKFNAAAEKIANSKDFQETFLKNKNDQSDESKDADLDKDELKKEAIKQVFGKTHPEFKEALSENLKKYATWVVSSVESIYAIPKKALGNPVVKKSVEEKDALLMQIISNISL